MMKSKKHVQPFYWLVTRFLESKAETAAHTEPFVQRRRQGPWEYPPGKSNSEKGQYLHADNDLLIQHSWRVSYLMAIFKYKMEVARCNHSALSSWLYEIERS